MISIGLPVVKTHFLRKALSSVLNQTYRDFELIIVDDHSDGNLQQIIQDFPDPRIRYFYNETRLGPVPNWNRSLSLAQGEFFVLFSDDDMYEPTFLEEMIKLIKKYPEVDVLHCRIKVIDENGKAIQFSPLCYEWESAIDFIWHRLAINRMLFVSNFVWRTQKMKDLGGFVDFPGAWCSDVATSFAMAIENGVAYCPTPLCCWRSSRFHLSKTNNSLVKLEAISQYRAYTEKILADIGDELENIEMLELTKELLPKHIEHYQTSVLRSYGLSRGILSLIAFSFRYFKHYQLSTRCIAEAIATVSGIKLLRDKHKK